LLGTMGKMAELLPKMENPSEQIQDVLAACECIKENLEGETAPNSLELLKTIETSIKENKLNILEYAKKLKSAFDSEVKANKEALFLPYKASMWDSLESIYLAAKEDPNWDALVMPIPYYDKKDNKFTDMHWEINYPKNINLIDYRKYNIEERKPDAIFIHNPYDNLNIVTSVHPDFYSERLRNLTKNLVYVPYFVGNGTAVADHFCTVPACIFAHKVIVQTEAEREIYTNAYVKVTKDRSNKFLALGSPKLDKAINSKKEDYEIPPEWKKLIGNKKVVFYNLSIGFLLRYTIENNKPSDKYFKKVRSVFEFFKKQSDFVLLWRPHPLLESTIKSMRPWLEAEYAEIVREYKSCGYGIYDDTEDLNRAVAVSDMYYGDSSSVTQLFDAAGKKIAVQVFGLPYIYGIYDDGNFVWFMDYYNTLYKHTKQNKETQLIGIIPENYLASWGIAKKNNKLYFAPSSSNKISVFDMDKRSFDQMDFRNMGKSDRKFKKTVSFKNFIYFIPGKYQSIMRLNTDTNEVEYFSKCVNEASGLKNMMFLGSCVVEPEIAMVIQDANAVMFFNMETNDYNIKHIGEKSEHYDDICFDGQNYYITSFYKDYVVKWNRQTDKTSKIKFPSSFSRKTLNGGSFIIEYSNKHLWLFPYAANNAYKINTNTDEVTELHNLVDHFEDKNINWFYNIAFTNGNFIYAGTYGKGVAEYNTDTGELNLIKDFGNEDALALWLCSSKSNNEAIAKTGTAGKTIWEYFK